MVLGVAWYREADWLRIKELFPDADELHDTHAEWVKYAEASVKRLTRAGVTVEPYTIDLDDFLGWCTVHGCEFDAKGRTAYVVEKLGFKYPSKRDPQIYPHWPSVPSSLVSTVKPRGKGWKAITTWGVSPRDVRQRLKVNLIRTLSCSFCSRTT